MANQVGSVRADDLEAGPDPGDPWQRRCELIALGLVLAVVGAILQYLFQGLAYSRAVSGETVSWSAFLPTVAAAGTFDRSLFLVVALALVVLAPGEHVGRLGAGVLNAISVLGVVLATLALVGLEETFRLDTTSPRGLDGQADGTAEAFGRLSGVSLWVPSIALAAGVGFLAWRTLLELYPEPQRPFDEDPDPDDDETEPAGEPSTRGQ
ncbi:MAG TPA: hypothetical protein VHK88_18190 [Aquihabitans sp.]|jgi:hypothetical protein|nr:hypothetical protein [Aquihabitans sp.]